MSELKVRPCAIEGLYEISLVVNRDDRGSFREVFQAEKLRALGLPDLGPVQWNISTNNVARHAARHPRRAVGQVRAHDQRRGVRRDRGPAPGLADVQAVRDLHARLRRTRSSSRVVWATRIKSLSDGGVYGYLVNQHWSPDAQYTLISFRDPQLAIPWPLEPDDR